MSIPKEIKRIADVFQEKGFEAYAVGGCVRDLLLGKKPKDWDIATNALPEQIQEIFPESFYENKYGTVGVKTDSADEALKIVEVTTYRVDEKYSDKRHPDEVRFTGNLREDLARRDFTINAMALRPDSGRPGVKHNFEIFDPFSGQEDLKNGIIRAVGDPRERFNEDALRMMRAVRFAVQLDVKLVSQAVKPGSIGFTIEEKTAQAIQKNANGLEMIAKERINDEFNKILMSDRPDQGILMLHDLGLLQYIIPELEKGVGVAQNRHHIYTIFEHNVLSLKFAAQKKFNLAVRLAALLHDIAKPQTKRGEGPDATFYNHQMLGARTAAKILSRLRYSREMIDRVANLVYNHMFVYDIGAVTEAGVRRLLRRVGPKNINDLLAVRIADRLGSGVPKAQPYRLRHFQYMVEKVQRDPISVKMLKVNGNDLMKLLEIQPGPKIGAILDTLLAEVIEDPAKNEKEYLENRAKELNELDLSEIRKMAKERIREEREAEDKEIKKRYWVE